ncbi:hypothetical protein FKP32DRAFT_1273138 [Trametes sanguinea]|nr:hypothetical protein FKP32DRAFT_1273138 [Trametes sanguinea]
MHCLAGQLSRMAIASYALCAHVDAACKASDTARSSVARCRSGKSDACARCAVSGNSTLAVIGRLLAVAAQARNVERMRSHYCCLLGE